MWSLNRPITACSLLSVTWRGEGGKTYAMVGERAGERSVFGEGDLRLVGLVEDPIAPGGCPRFLRRIVRIRITISSSVNVRRREGRDGLIEFPSRIELDLPLLESPQRMTLRPPRAYQFIVP